MPQPRAENTRQPHTQTKYNNQTEDVQVGVNNNEEDRPQEEEKNK